MHEFLIILLIKVRLTIVKSYVHYQVSLLLVHQDNSIFQEKKKSVGSKLSRKIINKFIICLNLDTHSLRLIKMLIYYVSFFTISKFNVHKKFWKYESNERDASKREEKKGE